MFLTTFLEKSVFNWYLFSLKYLGEYTNSMRLVTDKLYLGLEFAL